MPLKSASDTDKKPKNSFTCPDMSEGYALNLLYNFGLDHSGRIMTAQH